MMRKLTRKQIRQIRRERLEKAKQEYGGRDCGTPLILEKVRIEEEYKQMLIEHGAETKCERTTREKQVAYIKELNAKRKALIVGTSGLVGDFCLRALLDDPEYSQVYALVRKPILTTHRKLFTKISKFDTPIRELSPIQVDDVYCCLGSTIKKAGSQEAFKKVDFELVLSIAEQMRQNGAQQFLVISSMGADPNSRVFYSRVKGEMEVELRKLGYPCLRIIRPALLLGPRKEFRLGEKIAALLNPLIKPFMVGTMKKYRPVHAKSVAEFMVKIAHSDTISGVHVYESEQIN